QPFYPPVLRREPLSTAIGRIRIPGRYSFWNIPPRSIRPQFITFPPALACKNNDITVATSTRPRHSGAFQNWNCLRAAERSGKIRVMHITVDYKPLDAVEGD